LLKKDKGFADAVTSMGAGSTLKVTELGHPLMKELIPDFTQMGEAKQKAFIMTANALDKIKELDPLVTLRKIKHRIADMLQEIWLFWEL
jgi:hypothetical protein